MKQICLIVAVVAFMVYAYGCSSEINKQSSSSSDYPGTAKSDSGDKPNVKTGEGKADPDLPIAFVGKLDPYAAYDKKITDRIVMVNRPDCGSCHMKAKLTGRKLDLIVNRGKRVKQWTIEGKPDGKTVVFEQGKIRIVLKDGKLTGKFIGKMHANIDLAAVPAEKNDQ